tara:strand:- start:61 stop:585 length:525 start_codon:yes stop_codon:yes gene_type:complete
MSKLQVETISHTNNTTAMTIDSSGRVSQPSVPAFRVGLTSGFDITSTNTIVEVPWNEGISSESDNCFSQGGFSWSSGVVTVPIAGIYSFSLVARLDNLASNTYAIMRIYKNNTHSSNKEYYIIDGNPATNYQAFTGSGIFKLSASDTVRVGAFTDNDSAYQVDADSTFSGHLIG